LIATVCFPLLRTGTQEIVDFQEEPEQFTQLALDTCQGQVKFPLIKKIPLNFLFKKGIRNSQDPSSSIP